MMHVMTVVGTRPELIRLSRIIPVLDKFTKHTLVHTGQNLDPNLKDIFFEELEIRKPDWEFAMTLNLNSPFKQIGYLLECIETVIHEIRPDKILILGDTNSGLGAMAARRYGIPVYHMEAGNRCYDERVPEEMNRKIIDNCSDVLMPYTERSRQNLLREGFPSNKIYVTGNPIGEVIDHYHENINQSNILSELEVLPNSYYLVTLHRAENVDNSVIMAKFSKLLRELASEHPVIVSLHPRTAKRLELVKGYPKNVIFHEPFGFFDFVHLEKNAYAVLSDSGTVQEECAILGVPNLTLRDVTERPETIEQGCSCVTGWDNNRITDALKFVTEWDKYGGIPDRYIDLNVSTTILKILLGKC